MGREELGELGREELVERMLRHQRELAEQRVVGRSQATDLPPACPSE